MNDALYDKWFGTIFQQGAKNDMKRICCILIIAGLGGCASQVPAPISRVPAVTLTVAEVRADTERYIDAEVRWGGVITAVENRPEQTWVELVSRPLNDNGQPRQDSASEGRFIASFAGFADPMVYRPGDYLTVIGTIEAEVKRPIGEFEYSFPIVNVTASYRWQAPPEIRQYEYYPAPRWYYDPWPYYPRYYYYRSHPPKRR